LNKGYFGIALILLIVVGIFAFGFLSSITAKDSYLFIPVIDYNKMKDIVKNKPLPISEEVRDLVVSKNCQSLEMEMLSLYKFACKDLDLSDFKTGTVTGYAKEPFSYISYNLSQKVEVNVGCEQKTDYCKSPEMLYEAYCRPIYNSAKKDSINYYLAWPDYNIVNCKNYGPGYACKKGACVDLSGICGNGVIEQGENCDDGNNKDGDGCSSKCLLENAPDLVVSKIYNEPYSEGCVNSVHFEICNVGNLPVLGNFDIFVKVDDKNVTITYSAGQYGGFGGDCVHITDSQRLSYGVFGYGLDKKPVVEIVVDFNNQIAETNEQNNTLTHETKTGKQYLDNGLVCEETCTDLDDYLGENNVYVKSFVFGIDLYGSYDSEDFCDESGANLIEQICIPSKKGKVQKAETYPCFLYDQVCEDGKCIDKPGFVFSCEEQGDIGWEYGKKGKIIYTSVSGEIQEDNDSCYNLSTKTESLYGTSLVEYACSGPIPNFSYKDCLCYDGACVGDQSDLCDSDLKKSCSKDEVNYYKFGKATQTLKLYCDIPVYGNTKVEENSMDFEDYCMPNENGQICDPSISEYLNPNCAGFGAMLKETTCNGDNLDYIDYNCAGEGKTCVNDVCIEVGSDPEECVDYDGVNYFSRNYIWHKETIGWESDWWDICLDENILLEYSCDGNKPSYEKYDCSSIGKICGNGKCVAPAGQNESNTVDLEGATKEGVYTVNGKDYPLSEKFCIAYDKKIEYCDGQGNVFLSQDSCVNDIGGKVESSDYLVSWSCDSDKPKTGLTNCNSNGGHCEINECVK